MNSGTVIDGKLYVVHSRYSIDTNIEIFIVENNLLEPGKTVYMLRKHESLTWIDKHSDGSGGKLYTTGHDHAKAFIIQIDKSYER